MTTLTDEQPTSASRPNWLRAPRLMGWCLAGVVALGAGFALLDAQQLKFSFVLILAGALSGWAALLVVVPVRAKWAHILRWVLLVPGVSVLAAALPFALVNPGPGLVLWGAVLLAAFGTYGLIERQAQNRPTPNRPTQRSGMPSSGG